MGLFDSGGDVDIDELFVGPTVSKDLLKGLFKGKVPKALLKGKSKQEKKALRQQFKDRAGTNTADFLDFLETALPISDLETAGTDILRNSIPGFEQSLEQLAGLAGPAQDLVDTGFRTDLQPIIDAELRRFERETVPGLAERFGSALSGSGFQTATSDAAADLGVELGALQTALDEAAASRRITGLQLAPSIFGAPTAAATTFGPQIEAGGARERAREESVRPGARLPNALSFLTGLETQQGFLQQGGSGQPSDFASIVGALGNITAPTPTSGQGFF